MDVRSHGWDTMKVARSIFAVLLASAVSGCADYQAQQRAAELNQHAKVCGTDACGHALVPFSVPENSTAAMAKDHLIWPSLRRTILLFWKFRGLYGGGGGSFNRSEKLLAFSASRSSLISHTPRSTLSAAKS